ncbi:MAG: hypothetical protein WDO73_18975 [Ignavibacteriota bacterium]
MAVAGKVNDLRYQAVPKMGRAPVCGFNFESKDPSMAPVVRQLYDPPLLVGEAGLFGAGRFSFKKTPSIVERETALAGKMDGRAGRTGDRAKGRYRQEPRADYHGYSLDKNSTIQHRW